MRLAPPTLALAVLLATSSGGAQPDGSGDEGAPPPAEEGPSPEPDLPPQQVVTGIERPGTLEGDLGREIGNVFTWVPRNVIDYTFRGTAAAARFVANENLVPRYRQWVGAPLAGNFFVFPTLFADTGSTFSVGARMITDSPRVTTSQRFAIGGLRDLTTESRVLFKGSEQLPFAMSLEAFYEIQSSKDFYGVGVHPELDDRNAFVSPSTNQHATYQEKHARGIVSLGSRLGANFELFLSSSVYRRQIASSGNPQRTLNAVFEPGSVPGANVPGDPAAGKNTWITYAEIAARFDSREFRGRPAPGVLLEGYLGSGWSLSGEPVNYARHGWRAAGFIPIYRRTNILSPRIVFDRLVPLGGLPVPFYEIPSQPDFRGFDTRRDNLSMVASLDYTWQVVSFMSMRAFFDGATVAPALKEISLDQLKYMRFAGGLGFDFYNTTAILGRIAMSMSGDGPRLFVSLGNPEGFGDRQHRD